MVECALTVQLVFQSIHHGGPIEPALHNLCNKGHDMYYPNGAYKRFLAAVQIE